MARPAPPRPVACWRGSQCAAERPSFAPAYRSEPPRSTPAPVSATSDEICAMRTCSFAARGRSPARPRGAARPLDQGAGRRPVAIVERRLMQRGEHAIEGVGRICRATSVAAARRLPGTPVARISPNRRPHQTA